MSHALGPKALSNILALYSVHFFGYIFPLVTVPYTVRVLSPSGYGIGVFAQSSVGFFGILANYAFAFTATRAIAANRADSAAVAKIVTEVISTKVLMLGLSGALYAVLIAFWSKLHYDPRVMWGAFLSMAALSLSPAWLYQGLEEMRFPSRVTIVCQVLYLPALFIFVRHPSDTWKWLALMAASAGAATVILWWNAFRKFRLRLVCPRLLGIRVQLREGFHLFVSQAAVSFYTVANTFILGALTNATIAGYYGAAERVVLAVFSLLGPIQRAIYPRAAHLAAASDKDATLRLTGYMFLIVGLVGALMSAGLLVGAPVIVRIVLGIKFLPSITIMRILSPLPFLVALSNVLGVQIMIPFRKDRAFTVVLLAAGILNLGLGSLLALRWAGQGMATSVAITETVVTASMMWYVKRCHLFTLGSLFGRGRDV